MDDVFCTGYASPLGPMLLAATGRGLAGAWFEGQRHAPAPAGWRRADDHALLRDAAAQLQAYFEGRRTAFDLPLDPAWGTGFQRDVWLALRAIPRGATVTYAGLAARLGRPQAARAVGAAVGRNPWSVIVPCHRVLGTGGALTGYAGGLERKTALLRLEGVAHAVPRGLAAGAWAPLPAATAAAAAAAAAAATAAAAAAA